MSTFLQTGRSLEFAPLSDLSLEELAQVFAYHVSKYGDGARTLMILDHIRSREADKNLVHNLQERIYELKNEISELECDVHDYIYE